MAYANSFVIKNPASFTIGATEYKDQVSKVRLVPDTPIQTMRTWGGVDQDRDATAWTMEITGHNSRKAGGLALALDTAVAAGGTLTAVILPKAEDGEIQATVTFVPVPVEFGGEAGSWTTFEQEFAVVDQPTFAAFVEE